MEIKLFSDYESVDSFFSVFEKVISSSVHSIEVNSLIQDQKNKWRSLSEYTSNQIFRNILDQNSSEFNKLFHFDSGKGVLFSDIPFLPSDIPSPHDSRRDVDRDVFIYFIGCVKYFQYKSILCLINTSDRSRIGSGSQVDSMDLALLLGLMAPDMTYKSVLSRSSSVKKMMDKWEEKFISIESAVREKIKIDKPIAHWKATSDFASKKHISLSRWFYFLSCSPALLIIFSYWLGKLPSFKDISEAKDIVYLIVTVILVCVFPYFWVLRRLASEISTASKIRNDANYRASLIESYLSFTADGQTKLSDAERAIFWNALFRPMDAPEREELAPPTLVDLIKPK